MSGVREKRRERDGVWVRVYDRFRTATVRRIARRNVERRYSVAREFGVHGVIGIIKNFVSMGESDSNTR